MTPTEQDKELRRAIVNYRIKCDYYLSDRDEGVISQEEYETAISSELDAAVELITADRKRVALDKEEMTLRYAIQTLQDTNKEFALENLQRQLDKNLAQQEEV